MTVKTPVDSPSIERGDESDGTGSDGWRERDRQKTPREISFSRGVETGDGGRWNDEARNARRDSNTPVQQTTAEGVSSPLLYSTSYCNQLITLPPSGGVECNQLITEGPWRWSA